MPDPIIFLLLAVVVGMLIAFGALLGWLLTATANRSRANRELFTPRDSQSDLAATSRTLRRLADRGEIDETLHTELRELLRREAGRSMPDRLPNEAAYSPVGSEQVDPSPPGAEEATELPLPTAAPMTDDSPVLAEVVDEARPPVVPPDAEAAPLHPLDRPEPDRPPQPSRPQRQRRALADVLMAFMQDANIRWGELISGVLIVGSSIALVISLRREIGSLSEQFIYLPALLFMLATAAIHAAGNYTLRKWNLQATSRGVLIIATLLIPVNFLAAITITDESRQLPLFHPLFLSAVLIGLLAFGTMAYFASRALMRAGWRWLWIGVMGTSVGQLFINRLSDRLSTAVAAAALVALPLLAYLVATIGQLRDSSRRPRLGIARATDAILVLGMSTFGLAAAIGLLLSRTESMRMALAWLSTPLSLPAVVILVTGLVLHRRALSRRLTTIKTIGTSLAVLGAFLMLLAVAFAWPQPDLLIAVGIFSFAALTMLAMVGGLPVLHVAAIACGTLAAVVGFHLVQDTFVGPDSELSGRVASVLVMGRTSIVLTVLTAIVGGAAAGWFRRGDRASGLYYLIGAGGVACLAVLSALLVGFFGHLSREPDLATIVLLIHAVALLVASYFMPRTELTWIGGMLLLIGFVHGFGWNDTFDRWLTTASLAPQRPVLVAMMLHGLVCVIAAAVLGRQEHSTHSDGAVSRRWQHFVTPLTFSALLSSALVLSAAIIVDEQRFGAHALYVAGVSLIWLLSLCVQRSPLHFAIFQALATVAVAFAATAVCQRQSWWNESVLTPQHLHVQFGTLAVWCLAWSVGRRLARRRWSKIVELMRWEGQCVDEVVLAGAILAMFASCVLGTWPGVAIELGIAKAANFDNPEFWKTIFAAGAWIAAALLIAAATASLIERFSSHAFSGLFLAMAIIALLIAGRFYDPIAVASGFRWSFAAFGIGATAAICFSSAIRSTLARLSWLEWDDLPENLPVIALTWSLVYAAIPILGLTTVSLVQAAAGNAPGGPIADSFFGRIGPELSFGVPMALLVAMFITHAVRERQPSFMLAGSGVFQYLVNLAFFLPIVQDPDASWGWPVTIGCLQWNALGLAAYALVWLGMRRWVEGREDPPTQSVFDQHLVAQVIAVVVSLIALTGLATGVVIWLPNNLARFEGFGTWPSFLACVLGFAAAGWLIRSRVENYGIAVLLGFLFVIGGPLAISFEGRTGDWHAFHALTIVWLGIALAATALAWLAPSWRWQQQLVTTSVQWATAFVILSALLAVRGTFSDPQTPWWPCGVATAASLLAGALGFRTRRQLYAYGATLLAVIAVTIAWWGAWPTNLARGVIDLIHLNLTVCVVSGLVWLFAELRCQRRADRSFDRNGFTAVHRPIAIGATSLLFAITLLGFVLTSLLGSSRRNLDIADLTGWILLPPLAVLLIGALWDRRMKLVVPALFAWGLIVVLMVIDEVDERFDYDNQTVFVATGLAIAASVALAGHAWRFGANLAAVGLRMGMADPVQQLKRTATWLPAITIVITAVIVLIELCVVLAFRERWMRISASFAPLLLSYGVACQAQQQRRTTMQHASLVLVSIAAIFAAWADIEPGWHESFVLERAVRVLMVLAGLAFLFTIPVSRLTKQHGGDWFPVVRRMAAGCGAAAVAALSVVLLLELSFFEPSVGIPFSHSYQMVAVAIALVGLIVAFLSMALSSERDPLSLTEQGRMGYVYAAQVVGALLFAHLYLSRPDIFGAFQAYWPYIVMGIAFAGVGIGEVFQRSGLRVLADPFQRTGSFLPLLPALGWWLNRSLGIEAAGHYSLLLFFAGLLYVAVSMLRRSYISGVAAAIAGNAALWALLADYEPLSLMQHPQFWLIPPAVSALVASHINRRHLTEQQLTGTRYLCLLIIYVSSTADIFIDGIGDSLWEPMVLATLSVMGVFIGIGLQVRAFVYLGATFVFLSVVSMVWHAYANVQHVAIWWGFAIIFGLLILTFFGIFEKKRPELMRVVENMRKWEG